MGRGFSSTSQRPDPRSPADLRTFMQAASAALETPFRRCTSTWGAETTNERVLTLQVRNRNGSPIAGRFVVSVMFATTAGGAAVDTQTVGSPSAGTALGALPGGGSDLIHRFLTDATGRVVVGVTISGSATRYAHAGVDSVLESGDAAAWT